ncbi:MAG: hypothetical protein KME43_18930 [Myxacorys chilensis ATA2-1-KO14]|nr:hypothetical protein [Myxacorys chilensis ATA2-1-KO14]
MKTATLETEKTGLRGTEAQARTRLLLALWDMGGADIKKGELMARVVARPKEKTSSYQPILSQLEKEQAIAISGKRIQVISLSNKGMQLLDQGLKNAEFTFDASIGARTANALLKWIRASNDSAVRIAETNGNGSNGKVKAEISSYDEFKTEALKMFEELNKGCNYSGLVPIWHMRQEMGNCIGRTEFNNWIMNMQADQLFYLQTGEAIGATEEQKRNSIESEIRGLLFYISQPT